MSFDFHSQLESAYQFRVQNQLLENTNAFRVFHGPGEASKRSPSYFWGLDCYANQLWWTVWSPGMAPSSSAVQMAQNWFYSNMGIQTAYLIVRPEKEVPSEPQLLYGKEQLKPIFVSENECRYEIQMKAERHPGLFLDQRPLRQWITDNSKNKRILNLFSYTGSLSIAAAVGGASFVQSIDLSKEYTEWGKRNSVLNSCQSRMDFIYGDVFDWLPRLEKRITEKNEEPFDWIILDPPSFSRSKSKNGKTQSFSTQKDLKRLHELCLPLLNDSAILLTSINSAKISSEQFYSEIEQAIDSEKKEPWNFHELASIQQDPTFPPDPLRPETSYLKGFILKLSR